MTITTPTTYSIKRPKALSLPLLYGHNNAYAGPNIRRKPSRYERLYGIRTPNSRENYGNSFTQDEAYQDIRIPHTKDDIESDDQPETKPSRNNPYDKILDSVDKDFNKELKQFLSIKQNFIRPTTTTQHPKPNNLLHQHSQLNDQHDRNKNLNRFDNQDLTSDQKHMHETIENYDETIEDYDETIENYDESDDENLDVLQSPNNKQIASKNQLFIENDSNQEAIYPFGTTTPKPRTPKPMLFQPKIITNIEMKPKRKYNNHDVRTTTPSKPRSFYTTSTYPIPLLEQNVENKEEEEIITEAMPPRNKDNRSNWIEQTRKFPTRENRPDSEQKKKFTKPWPRQHTIQQDVPTRKAWEEETNQASRAPEDDVYTHLKTRQKNVRYKPMRFQPTFVDLISPSSKEIKNRRKLPKIGTTVPSRSLAYQENLQKLGEQNLFENPETASLPYFYESDQASKFDLGQENSQILPTKFSNEAVTQDGEFDSGNLPVQQLTRISPTNKENLASSYFLTHESALNYDKNGLKAPLSAKISRNFENQKVNLEYHQEIPKSNTPIPRKTVTNINESINRFMLGQEKINFEDLSPFLSTKIPTIPKVYPIKAVENDQKVQEAIETSTLDSNGLTSPITIPGDTSFDTEIDPNLFFTEKSNALGKVDVTQEPSSFEIDMSKSGTIANSNDGSAVQEVAKSEFSPLNLALSTSIYNMEPSFNLSQSAFLNNSTPEAISQPYRIEYPTIPSTMTENGYSYSQNSFGQIPREKNRTHFIPENPTNLENLSSTNKPINFDGTNQDIRTNESFENFSGATETAKSATETAPPTSTIPNAISLATPSRGAKNLFIPHAEVKTFGELENPSLSTNNNGELSRTTHEQTLSSTTQTLARNYTPQTIPNLLFSLPTHIENPKNFSNLTLNQTEGNKRSNLSIPSTLPYIQDFPNNQKVETTQNYASFDSKSLAHEEISPSLGENIAPQAQSLYARARETIDSTDLTMFPGDGIGKVDKELEEIMPE
uniref:Uncharacterized protein n=1 Tax=Acrobeloides nanus TaxID=290746 RepID=A0A914DH00_9BILA